jgi:DNA repair protein RadC
MSLKDLIEESRPREKLMAFGAGALADAELVALLLRTGIRGKNVLQLSRELLDAFGGLSGLLHAGLDDLKRIKGLGGTAKRAELAAVIELARRAMAEGLRAQPVLETPETLAHYLQLHLSDKPYEVFAALFLDTHHRLIAMEELFRGTLAQTSVYPRELVARSLHHHAAAVVLAHNHPSGTAEPSRADELLTKTLVSALALIDVRVLDHLVVGRGHTLSMAQLGFV